jgi:hypothetical protein
MDVQNEIEAAREEAFYVDYVSYDEGDRWISPKERYPSTPWPANVCDAAHPIDGSAWCVHA